MWSRTHSGEPASLIHAIFFYNRSSPKGFFLGQKPPQHTLQSLIISTKNRKLKLPRDSGFLNCLTPRNDISFYPPCHPKETFSQWLPASWPCLLEWLIDHTHVEKTLPVCILSIQMYYNVNIHY